MKLITIFYVIVAESRDEPDSSHYFFVHLLSGGYVCFEVLRPSFTPPLPSLLVRSLFAPNLDFDSPLRIC